MTIKRRARSEDPKGLPRRRANRKSKLQKLQAQTGKRRVGALQAEPVSLKKKKSEAEGSKWKAGEIESQEALQRELQEETNF